MAGVLLALLCVLALGAATLTRPQAASAATCSSASVTVAAMHSPDGTPRPFYADFGNGSTLHSGYVGYELSGAALGADTWVRLSGFSADLGLAANQSASIPARATSQAGNPLVFAYLTAKNGYTTTPQSFTVEVWTGKPGQAGSTQICAAADGFSEIQKSINANANKINTIDVSTATPALGGSFDVTATGDSGTMGNSTTDASGGNGVFSLAPAMDDSWPADAFSLTGVQVTMGTTTTRDRLRLYPALSSTSYTVVYHFTVRNTTPGTTTVKPVQNIASGSGVKYTGAYPSTAVTIASPTTSTSLVKTATALAAATVTYRVDVTNSAASPIVLDSLKDTPTPTSGWSFVLGSAKLGATAIADPANDSGTLFFNGPFTVPASGSIAITYKLLLSATVQNAAVGKVGDVEIGASSGSANQISVDPAAPIVTSASLPDGTVGSAYSQTLAAGAGTSPYTWSVTAGALPAGLTLAAGGTISGSPTTAGSSSFTVTVRDAAAKTAAKSLTILVAAAAGGGGGGAGDTTAPAGSVSVNAGAAATNSASATLSLSATDAVGVTAYRVANGSDCSAAAWVAVTATTALSTTAPLTLPAGDGAKTVCAQFEDAVGNVSTTATASIALDTARPSVTLSTPAANPTNGAFTVTATFSESVGGLALGGLSVANGSASSLTGSGATYTFTVTPSGSGTTTVDLGANGATDAAGNGNTAAAQISRTIDLTRATVALTSTAAATVGGAFSVTATFSEGVTGLTLGGISVGNGSASGLTGTGTTYTFTVTPAAGGAVTVDLAANTASDAAGNGNTAAAQLSRTAALDPPTITLASAAADPVNGVFTVTATFSASVSGFTAADVTAGDATIGGFAGSGSSYSFTATPTADGTVTIDVAAGAATDSLGHTSLAAPQLTRTADVTRPTLALGAVAAGPVNGPFDVTATFSESVGGFTAADVVVVNGVLSAFAGTGGAYAFTVTPSGNGPVTVDVAAAAAAASDSAGGAYAFTVTPSGNGPVTVDVAAAAASDSAGNTSSAASRLTRTADLTAPTVALAAAAAPTGAFTVTVTFSESVSGFSLAGVTVGNGTASALAGSGTSYSFTITPGADGAVTVDVAAGAAADAAGNASGAVAQLSRTVDSTRPALALSSTSPSPTNQAFVVTATFSEPVTGFVAGDVAVANGAVSGFTGSGAGYSFTVTPASNGPVTVDVAAGAATDAAGNASTPATQLSRSYDQVAPVVTFGSQPAATTSSTAASFVFAASETVTFQCSLDAAAFAPCASPVSVAGLGAGDHRLVVRATDGAANVSETTYAWTAAAPVIAFAIRPGDPSDENVSFAWSSTAIGVSYTCKLDGHAATACATSASYSDLADGPHLFTVTATGGLTGSATIGWTVQRRQAARPASVVIIPTIDPIDLLGRPQAFRQSSDGAHSAGPFTRMLQVKLHIPTPKEGADEVLISNHPDFREQSVYPIAADELYAWTLLAGPSGDRRVYIRFDDAPDAPVGDATIVLDQELPELKPAYVRSSRRIAAAARKQTQSAAAYCGSRGRRWIDLRGADGFSGLNAVQVASNPSHPCAWRPFLPTLSYRLPGSVVYLRIEDRVGNISRWYRLKTPR